MRGLILFGHDPSTQVQREAQWVACFSGILTQKAAANELFSVSPKKISDYGYCMDCLFHFFVR